jgi:hypothetical protein
MTALANFAGTPRTAFGQVSVANTARDGTGTVATIFTAGTAGSRIDDIELVAAGTVTAGVVRLFLHDGSTYRLWKEILVTATTPSTTVAVWSAALRDEQLILATSSWSLRATTHNAEAINVIVRRAGDF